MRAHPVATGATAALALLALSGLAHAIPPEPASAPKGAHVAAAPPPSAISAQPQAAGSVTPGITADGTSKSPMDITSEGVEVIQPQHLTIFRGNVEATQDQTRLRTPELRVWSKAKAATPGQPQTAVNNPLGIDQAGGVDHIQAAGPVYYITPTENARGDAMLYEAGPNVITLTGHVVLVQGKSVGKGDKLIINRATGQSNLISDAPTTPGGRVRVILYPQQQAAQPGAPATPAH